MASAAQLVQAAVVLTAVSSGFFTSMSQALVRAMAGAGLAPGRLTIRASTLASYLWELGSNKGDSNPLPGRASPTPRGARHRRSWSSCLLWVWVHHVAEFHPPGFGHRGAPSFWEQWVEAAAVRLESAPARTLSSRGSWNSLQGT